MRSVPFAASQASEVIVEDNSLMAKTNRPSG